MNAVEFLLSDARGIYIPQNFCEGFDVEAWGFNTDSWEIKTCLTGPETDGYWDAWYVILDNARYEKDGNVYHLHQDGDLWALDYEHMTDEEKDNFGFEE